MPQPPADERHDSPMFLLADAVAIAAGATFDLPEVECAGYETVSLVYTINQIHDRRYYGSLDGVLWGEYATGGWVGAAPGAVNAPALPNRAQVIPCAGLRFVRVQIRNAAASVATLTAHLGLAGRGD